jgi:hypothetical protein
MYLPLEYWVIGFIHFGEKVEHEGVSKRFRTGRLERELQTVQLSATRYICIAI